MDTGSVSVDFRKWPNTPHWRFTMWRLGEDEHGTWLWAPPGTEAQRGEESPIVFDVLAVKLIPRDRWWTAIWNDEHPEMFDLYVDVVTPPRWAEDRVTMIDLDLDVVRDRNGSTMVLDEDEFTEHRKTLGYPEHVADRARATTAAVYLSVAAEEEPFGDTGRKWFDRARSQATR